MMEYGTTASGQPVTEEFVERTADQFERGVRTRWYLGMAVEVPIEADLSAWVKGCVFADDRKRKRWRMWGPQLRPAPWA